MQRGLQPHPKPLVGQITIACLGSFIVHDDTDRLSQFRQQLHPGVIVEDFGCVDVPGQLHARVRPIRMLAPRTSARSESHAEFGVGDNQPRPNSNLRHDRRVLRQRSRLNRYCVGRSGQSPTTPRLMLDIEHCPLGRIEEPNIDAFGCCHGDPNADGEVGWRPGDHE
jgi:hypothetical protein